MISTQKQKWLNLIVRPLEEKKVIEIFTILYNKLEYQPPEILIVDSPQVAERILDRKRKQQESFGLPISELLNERIRERLQERVETEIEDDLKEKLEEELIDPLWKQLHAQFWLPINSQHQKQFGRKRAKINFHSYEFVRACYFDFAKQIGVNFDESDYEIYKQFHAHIGMYIAFENLAIAIERPIFVSWNEAGKLHAEGKPAIQFRDDFSIYALEGTKIPAKYGKLNPDRWSSKWLRGEPDSELIPYIEKWQKFCLSTESIDPERSIQAVKEVYKLMDYPEPKILIFDSLGAALDEFDRDRSFLATTGRSLHTKFSKKFSDILFQEMQNQLDDILFKLGDTIFDNLYPQQLRDISNFIQFQLYHQINYESKNNNDLNEDEESCRPNNDISELDIVSSYFFMLCKIDFCISELKCKLDLQKWQALQDLMSNCGAVLFYENVCLISDRPKRISFDNNGDLHGEGIPAIEFSDGFGAYAFHGTWLPAKYGKIHPSQWKTEWLLENNESSIERVLIENIGYDRIQKEFNSRHFTALDKYKIMAANLHDKITLTGKTEKENETIEIESLPSYEFEVISIDSTGEITNREKKQAKLFTEDLGNNINLEMVVIPAGEFLMGTANSSGEESPQHLVKLSSFLLSKYPITQAQWRAVASLPKIKLDLEPEPSNFIGDDLPVECITKEESIEFCVRLWQKTGRLYSLPSEAQWEYACRAHTTTYFYFGDAITTDIVNYNGESSYKHKSAGIGRGQTTPVGSFPPNAFGLYDMHGNVFEFCADRWHENYHGTVGEGKSRIGGCDLGTPVKGGGWKSYYWFCRSACRNDDFRDYDKRYSDVGFRVAHFIF